MTDRGSLDPLGRTRFVEELDSEIHSSVAPGQYVCDFCLTPNPTWTYPCGEVMLISGTCDGSNDEWAACDACHDLIEGGDLKAMVIYMVTTERTQPLVEEWELVPLSVHIAAKLHNVSAFLAGRTGPAYRNDPKTGVRL